MASKTSKLMMETAKKKQYLDYYKMMVGKNKMPMTQAQHAKSGTEPVYFKGVRKNTIESQLEQAGLSKEQINKLKRKK